MSDPYGLLVRSAELLIHEAMSAIECGSTLDFKNGAYEPVPGTLDEDFRDTVDELLFLIREIEELVGPCDVAADWVRRVIDGEHELNSGGGKQ